MTKFHKKIETKKGPYQRRPLVDIPAACASFLSDALFEANKENLAFFLGKHPPQDFPIGALSPNSLEQLRVSPDIVLELPRAS